MMKQRTGLSHIFWHLPIAMWIMILPGTLVLFSCKEPSHNTQSSYSRNSELVRQKDAALRVEQARKARYREESRRIARALEPETLAAQVLMSGVDGKETLQVDMKKLLSEIPVGAMVLFKYNIADSPRAVHAFIAECTSTAALSIPGGTVAGVDTQFRDTQTFGSSPGPSSGTGLTLSPGPSPTPNLTPSSMPGRLYPFVAIDHEGGAVYRLGQVATHLPPAERYLRILLDEQPGPAAETSVPVDAAAGNKASVNTGTAATANSDTAARGDSRLEAPQDTLESAWHVIRQAAYLSGRELRTLGITMNLAPVAEVLSPENRAFLQNRSFAADPVAAASAAAAFIQGMGEAGVASVVKHFPASAAADPHYGRSVLDVDRKRLEYLVSPLEALLKQPWPPLDQDGPYPPSLRSLPIWASGVMVAHTTVPVIDPDLPASLSSQVMQDWIKDQLGFQGIVLADDFTMKAVTSTGITPEEAIVQAFLAGVDMVMVWPRDLRRFHRILVERAKSDILLRERLTDAASRIIYQKLLWGLVERPPEQLEQAAEGSVPGAQVTSNAPNSAAATSGDLPSRDLICGSGEGEARGLTRDFNEEGYDCMRKDMEQFLRERNLR